MLLLPDEMDDVRISNEVRAQQILARPLSRTIRDQEERLGVTLIVRPPRRLQLDHARRDGLEHQQR